MHWIPAWAMEEVSSYLRVPKSEVHGVASSFPELRLKAPGRHIVRACTGLSCYLKGSGPVLKALEDDRGIEAGHTTEDDAVTLEEAPCLFVCAMAPAMELDGGTFGRLTPVDRLQAIPRDRQASR